MVTAQPSEPAAAPGAGVHLDRTDENVAEIDDLAGLLGGPVGLAPLLGDLNRRARRSHGPLGRAVAEAFTWDRPDRWTRAWWPQGISTSADASATGTVAGRRVVAVTWYAPEVDGQSPGSRVTFLDLDTMRYRHVLLVVPELSDGRLGLQPLRVHAGGVAWCGPYLHIAATARGFITCRVDDVLRIPDDRRAATMLTRLGVDQDAVASYGYRYVLPVRFRYRAHAADGTTRLRYSFLSLDRRSPAALVAGEYGRGAQTTRLARFPLDLDTALLETGPDGRARPVELGEGVRGMQGAAVVDGRWYVTVSRGPTTPGTVYVGTPGRLVPHRWAVPMGPEDIAAWPGTDRLWTLTEHPGRRWLLALRRSWFDRA
ncbi:hypothetical protein [Nocardioides sp.]|uniref:hypothetical protein n=1 Tax=Nocardioides sp. TaxID=35761 RepID=UPI0035286C70